MLIYTRTFEIPWGDCDAAGIVFYPRYFEWFDHSTHGLFTLAGFKQMRTLFDIIGIPMVDTRAKFGIPSRYGDDITIETQVAAFRRSSFDVHHRLLRGQDLAVEGFETRVWTGPDPENPDRLKSKPIPQAVIDALSQELGPRPSPQT